MKNISFHFDETTPLHGLFHYLQNSDPDSVIIETSSSTNNDSKILVSDESSAGFWESSKNNPNPWIQMTLKNAKFNLIGYTLKAASRSGDDRYPNSWIVAGSNDGEDWPILDQVDYNHILCEANAIAPFECNEKESEDSFSIFRIQMTEPTENGDWTFSLARIEFFGDLEIIEEKAD